jgi:hypothetical protein
VNGGAYHDILYCSRHKVGVHPKPVIQQLDLLIGELGA